MKALSLLLLGACLGPILSPALRGETESELKTDSGAVIIRYVVEAPDGIAPAGTADPARQVGLILCFAEHDRPTGDEILPVREALKRLGLRDQYVLLAGHSQARKFGPADHEPIEKLIAWAKKTYPVNPRRIYLYGKGEGGKISGEFAMMHPGLVTAGITYSWGWWTMPSELKDAIDPLNSAPEFYMVLGLRDLSYHLTTVRDAYSRVSYKGYHVIYREFEDLGARTYHPPSNDDAVAWVTSLRNKNIPPSPEELKLLERPSIGPEGFFSGLASVGGAKAGDAVRKLLESGDASVRAAAAETCVHAIFSEPTISAVAKKMADPSPKVRNAVFRALAVNANWRSEAAQQALVQAATHPDTAGIDEAGRVSALDAIVQAVRFQVKGVRQDPPLFKALVTLLNDKNDELRVMASNTLAPIRDRDFRGDAGRPERKMPDGGWQHWLDEVTAKAAGYRKDYEVCGDAVRETAVDLFCKGGTSLPGSPAGAFDYTSKAAEQGYVPAEAALGMMYATGKGVEQNYPEAAKWWVKAAEGGHFLAAQNASMIYRGVPGVPADPALSEKWATFVAEHNTNPAQ
ncbi:MAG: sel1 repeat family protein [Acidobacteriota bacterium]|nr:sel1 repeat family protein [Acidobacteriota bacterium]